MVRISHIRIVLVSWLLAFSSQLNAQEVKLLSKSMSECLGNGRAEESYSNIQQTDSTLSFDLKLNGNCAMIDSINYLYQQDSLFLKYDYRKGNIDTLITIDTTYHIIDTLGNFELSFNLPHETILANTALYKTEMIIVSDTSFLEMHVWCKCSFSFNVVFSGLRLENLVIVGHKGPLPYFPEGRRVRPVSFDVINGDTINYIDRLGLPQGEWVDYNKKNQVEETRYYNNGLLSEYVQFTYHENGKIRFEIWINGKHGRTLKIEYDSNGNEVRRREYDGEIWMIDEEKW